MHENKLSLIFDVLQDRVAGNPAAAIALARQKAAIGDRTGAARLCFEAIDDPSCPPESRAIAAELMSGEVPRWHFLIVRDRKRNEAYRRALEQAITPGCTVLEIGTGTGLLAMIAARAGAARVFTCEADPVIAVAAERVIAHNGFADRVTVLPKHSREIDVEADLGGAVDILVAEIVSNELLGEDVLETMEDAVGRLVRRDGAIIPARGRVMIALAEDVCERDGLMPQGAEFDLCPFDALSAGRRDLPVLDPRIVLRSDPVTLFDFDFAGGGPFPPENTSVRLRSHGGRVSGSVQWIALEMGDGNELANPPGGEPGSCWGMVFRTFFDARDTRAGDTVSLGARHERRNVRIWPDWT